MLKEKVEERCKTCCHKNSNPIIQRNRMNKEQQVEEGDTGGFTCLISEDKLIFGRKQLF